MIDFSELKDWKIYKSIKGLRNKKSNTVDNRSFVIYVYNGRKQFIKKVPVIINDETFCFSIGSSSSCDLVLDNPMSIISARNLEITVKHHELYAKDPKSTNGVLLDGEPVYAFYLLDVIGKDVAIGDYILNFVHISNEEFVKLSNAAAYIDSPIADYPIATNENNMKDNQWYVYILDKKNSIVDHAAINLENSSDSFTIGRASDCSFRIYDENSIVSKYHLRIVLKEKGLYLIDESTNGTYNHYKRFDDAYLDDIAGKFLYLGRPNSKFKIVFSPTDAFDDSDFDDSEEAPTITREEPTIIREEPTKVYKNGNSDPTPSTDNTYWTVHLYSDLDSSDVSSRILFKDNSQSYAIGRAPDCDFVIEDSSKRVSRYHLYVKSEGNELFLIDNSANGTIINDEEVSRVSLENIKDQQVKLNRTGYSLVFSKNESRDCETKQFIDSRKDV